MAVARQYSGLGNVMARAVLTGDAIINHLPLLGTEGTPVNTVSELPTTENSTTTLTSFDDMQKTYFQQLLVQCHGKIAGPGGAADIAKMHHNTLRSRLEKLGLL